ncbi:MAG: hypothetical protein OEZ14_01890 [Acidimicrobiia bacterium]|nr:hypothetical protein [Acidimicrobiia bacterium]MDH5519261.1 hypothetical protein [Acidimicrobiia bacterium]
MTSVDLVELPTPVYHAELRDLLTATEPELWRWFAESKTLEARADDEAELALLKSAIRLDGGVHDVLVAHAILLRDAFAITEPVALYQELGASERNAHVFRLNGQVNVVFGGDLLELLEPSEQQMILAHELAHIALWRRDDGDFGVLDHMIHRLASDPGADDTVIETARRLRLHTEVWADAAALAAVDDIDTAVAAMVKVGSGLRHVDPAAYLRQAEDILALDSRATTAWTHPELHIRVACLSACRLASLSARQRHVADPVLATLINGPDDLDRLDLLGQRRLQILAARVLATATGSSPSDAVTDYLRRYPDLILAGAKPIADGELTELAPSVRWFGASLLVDLALVDDEVDDLADLRAMSAEADRQGVADEFDKILAKASEQTRSEVAALRADTAT